VHQWSYRSDSSLKTVLVMLSNQGEFKFWLSCIPSVTNSMRCPSSNTSDSLPWPLSRSWPSPTPAKQVPLLTPAPQLPQLAWGTQPGVPPPHCLPAANLGGLYWMGKQVFPQIPYTGKQESVGSRGGRGTEKPYFLSLSHECFQYAIPKTSVHLALNSGVRMSAKLSWSRWFGEEK
jgi:hypothetical protein